MKQIAFRFIIPAVFSMVFQPLFGQIVGQSTDTNYYNTTVVYVKENTRGTDVLASMEGNFGMGDMVRIEVAPPPPPRPVAVPISARPVANPAPTARPKTATAPAQPQAAAPKSTVDTGLAKQQQRRTPVVQPAPTPTKLSIKATPAPQQQRTVVAKTGKTAKAAKKSVKKSKKHQSRPPVKMSIFRKKHGKQRYSCPKF